MQRWILVCVAVVFTCSICSEASAWGFRSRSVSTTRTVTTQRYASPQAACNDKAARMAASGAFRHLGGGYGPGGRAEGIGMASTPGKALAICCYANSRVCIASSVVWSEKLRSYMAVRIYR